MTKTRSTLAKLLLSCAAVALCLSVAEVVLRATWHKPMYGYPEHLHIPDDTRGFRYQPGFNGRFPGRGFNEISIEINSHGLRDRDHDYLARGGLRILGLGDSVTFGAGVALEDTYLSQLERASGAEVIKAGVNGYDFDQYLTYYREEGQRYGADIVLVGIVLNDARPVDVDDVKAFRFGYGALSPQSVKERLRNQCFVCNLVYLNGRVLTNRLRGRGADYNDQYFRFVYELWEGPTWDRTRTGLQALITLARANGSRVVLLVFPYTQQFQHSELKWARGPQAALRRFGAEAGVMVIDLLPHLDRPDFRELYLPSDDVHLNARGHAIVGAVVDRALRPQSQ